MTTTYNLLSDSFSYFTKMYLICIHFQRVPLRKHWFWEPHMTWQTTLTLKSRHCTSTPHWNHTASMSDIATALLLSGWVHTVVSLNRSLIPLITVHCKKCYLHMDELTKKHRASWGIPKHQISSRVLPYFLFFLYNSKCQNGWIAYIITLKLHFAKIKSW